MKPLPCITEQLRFHQMARDAALEGKALAEIGDTEAARVKLAEAEKWFAEYRRHGGTLTTLT